MSAKPKGTRAQRPARSWRGRQPSAVPTTMPSTSPIAHPVRQWSVALKARRSRRGGAGRRHRRVHGPLYLPGYDDTRRRAARMSAPTMPRGTPPTDALARALRERGAGGHRRRGRPGDGGQRRVPAARGLLPGGAQRPMPERPDARERLEVRARQAAALAALGEAALVERNLDVILARTCAVLGQQLGADLANVLELAPDADRFVLRAGWNWPEAWVGARTVPAGRRSLAGYVIETGGPVVVDDLQGEERFDAPPLMLSAGIASSLTVPIGPEDDVFGVLSVHSQRQRAFSADDASFAQGVANVLAAAVRRARDDEALREGEASLRLVLAGTGTAAWWWEVGDDRIRWSEGVAALHGLPEDGAPVEYEDLIELSIPTTARARRRRPAQRRGERRLRAGVPHRAPGRRRRWLETEAHAERDAGGSTVRLMGIVRDVTDRRLAEKRERLLVDASELLGRAGDVREALHELAMLLVGGVADLCEVTLSSGESVAAGRLVEVAPGARPAPQREPELVLPLRGRAGELGSLALPGAAGSGATPPRTGLRSRARATGSTGVLKTPRESGQRRRARGSRTGRPSRAAAGPLGGADDERTTREEVDAAFVRPGSQPSAPTGVPRRTGRRRAGDARRRGGAGRDDRPLHALRRDGERRRRSRRRRCSSRSSRPRPSSRPRTRAWPPSWRTRGWKRSPVLPLTTGQRSVGFGGVAFRGPRELAGRRSHAPPSPIVPPDRAGAGAGALPDGLPGGSGRRRGRAGSAGAAPDDDADARRRHRDGHRRGRLPAAPPSICSVPTRPPCAPSRATACATLARVPDLETEPLAAAARPPCRRCRPWSSAAGPRSPATTRAPHCTCRWVAAPPATAFVTAWWTHRSETPARQTRRAPLRGPGPIALSAPSGWRRSAGPSALAAALERLLDPPRASSPGHPGGDRAGGLHGRPRDVHLRHRRPLGAHAETASCCWRARLRWRPCRRVRGCRSRAS